MDLGVYRIKSSPFSSYGRLDVKKSDIIDFSRFDPNPGLICNSNFGWGDTPFALPFAPVINLLSILARSFLPFSLGNFPSNIGKLIEINSTSASSIFSSLHYTPCVAMFWSLFFYPFPLPCATSSAPYYSCFIALQIFPSISHSQWITTAEKM